LGNPDQQKRGFSLLTHHRKRIQGLVARAVILKYTPTLKFLMDDSVVRGNKVLDILKEIEKTLPDETEGQAPTGQGL
jgi:ribosome-binding factor A